MLGMIVGLVAAMVGSNAVEVGATGCSHPLAMSLNSQPSATPAASTSAIKGKLEERGFIGITTYGMISS